MLALARALLWFSLICLLLPSGVLLARHAPAQTASRLNGLPAPSATLPHPALGVHLNPLPGGSDTLLAELTQLHAAGIVWVRIPIEWAAIEPQPGAPNWQPVDELLAVLAQSDLMPVFVLTGSPQWAVADATRLRAAHAPPDRLGDFAAFAQAFARRAARALPHLPQRGYQIWHEPNLAMHWGYQHVNAVAYAQLARAAASALRAGDPDALILSGALSPTNDQGHLAQNEPYFLRRFLAAGGGFTVDAIAVQPYGFAAPPLAPAPSPRALTFDRLSRIRHSLVQAGYGHLPLWATSFGWNRESNPIWRAVDANIQLDYIAAAVDLARGWPWLHGLGWPHAQHPGFALTPALLQAYTGNSAAPTPDTLAPETGTYARGFGLSPLVAWWGIVLAVGIALQRTYAATRLAVACLPRLRPTPLRVAVVWAVIGPVYFLATWPPLILFCWLLIGALVWLRPRWGLYLAAAALPFFFFHKELLLAELRLTLAPGLLLTLALGIRLLLRLWRHGRRKARRLPHPLQKLRLSGGVALAAGWLGLALLGGIAQGLLQLHPAENVGGAPLRHVTAFIWAFLHLVLAPLILWVAVWHFATRPHHRRALLLALAAGGMGAAALGLTQWLGGTGVYADGTLRLTGPYYSPNHMALYGVRTLMLLVGLGTLFVTVKGKMLWLLGMALCLGTLLLTASRGALILGLPAGVLVLGMGFGWRFIFRSTTQHSFTRGIGRMILLLLVGASLVAGTLLIWQLLEPQRLANTASVAERWAIWQAAWQMWRDAPWTGVGPGGFYWTLPAYIRPESPIDTSLRHPHNLVLELITTGGVAGAIWWLAFAIWTARRLRRLWPLARQSAPAVGVLAGLAAGIAHGQVDAFMALPDLAAWNALALAVVVFWRTPASAPARQ